MKNEADVAIGLTGVRVHNFNDGSLGITLGESALHLEPKQAEQLRFFMRVFDKHQAPRTLLTEAAEIIDGDRERTHGLPSKNLKAIASIWSAIAAEKLRPGEVITEQLVCLMMIGLKLARAANRPSHRENWLDTVGYAALAERCGYVEAPTKATEASQAALRG